VSGWRALARGLTGTALAAAVLLPATAGAHWPATVSAQRSHAQCPLPGEAAQAVLIDRPALFGAWLAGDEAALIGRSVDWRRERVLVVALTRQPTAGIGITLEPAVPHRGRRALLATAQVTRPAPGEMAAMVLTRPCVIAVLPRGGWREVGVQLEGHTLQAQRLRTGEVPAAAPKAPGGANLVPLR
jgi:hypothetical protein